MDVQSQAVTVSKNALKLRLFNIGTPFLTLGLSGEQAAPGERNVSKAPRTLATNPQMHSFAPAASAAAFHQCVFIDNQ